MCKDREIVRDIFWTHHDSIKLLNMFPTVLIINSMHKTNKYKLTLLEIVGVIFTEKVYSAAFPFLESKKEDNTTWALKVCQTMLKEKEKTPKVIVTRHNATFMNSVAKVFPTPYTLLFSYHITKNARNRIKPAVGTKQIKGEDGKMVKASVIVEIIMYACNVIINYSTEELNGDTVILFKKVCDKYQDF